MNSVEYHRAIKAHRLAEAFEGLMATTGVPEYNWIQAAQEAPGTFWGRLATEWNVAEAEAGRPRKINPPSSSTVEAMIGILQARIEERHI